MKKIFYLTILCLACIVSTGNLIAQEVIVTDDATYTTPADGSVLDVKSTTKGLIIPRMTTTQRTTLGNSTPANGVVVYDIDLDSFWYWDTGAWHQIAASNLDLTNVSFGDGSNYSTFENDGTLLFVGDARVWNDFVVPGTAATTGSVNPPDFSEFVDGIYTYAFRGGNSNVDQVFIAVQMPHDWDEGTSINPHVHWAPATVSTGTQQVEWNFEYVWQNYQSEFPSTSTKINDVTGEVTATHRHNITEFGPIDATGKSISSILMCRLWRDGDNDSYNGDAFLLSFDIHYQTNTAGSRTEFTK